MPESTAPADVRPTVTRGVRLRRARRSTSAPCSWTAPPVPDAQVRIPLSMLNRHGLVAGATGTGKTKTLQLMAEQLSAQGVPGVPRRHQGRPVRHGRARARRTTRSRRARRASARSGRRPAIPVELFALGGQGTGVPVRATVTSFGPVLLAKVLDLNEMQASSLGLVFHFADKAGLPLLDLKDLRAVIQYLTSDEGKARAGGPRRAEQGDRRGDPARADRVRRRRAPTAFFGEPEFDTTDLLRTAPRRARASITCLELPAVQDQPALFSTFLMWLLADLFDDLPEVGDVDKPKLVFFFDEAHLLFNDASQGVPGRRSPRPCG